MKSFIQINRMVADQGYGKFLSYLLVNKALDIKIKEPNTLAEHLIVGFEK